MFTIAGLFSPALVQPQADRPIAVVPHAAGLAHLTGANARFHAAVRNLTVGDDTDILHISPELIREYLDDLRRAGLL